MDNRNLKHFTVQDLINKMKKLRQKYKEEKDKANKSGTGRRRKWVFFDRMDRILCDRPQVKPPLVIDSSVTEAGLESGNLSRNMTLHRTFHDLYSSNGVFFLALALAQQLWHRRNPSWL